uniref:Uncharacterized protein n=1 Tax=Arundo donax TaxID=35708 RepID=A0A0A9CL80_ARUDO
MSLHLFPLVRDLFGIWGRRSWPVLWFEGMFSSSFSLRSSLFCLDGGFGLELHGGPAGSALPLPCRGSHRLCHAAAPSLPCCGLHRPCAAVVVEAKGRRGRKGALQEEAMETEVERTQRRCWKAAARRAELLHAEQGSSLLLPPSRLPSTNPGRPLLSPQPAAAVLLLPSA